LIAARYASALFELADEKRALDQVAADLETLKRLLADNADLRNAMRNPVFDSADVGRAIAEVATASKLSPIVISLLGVLARNRRLFLIDAIASAFLAELARRRGEMTVDVTSAQELTSDQAKRLTEKLNATLAARVRINASVDPCLLGGLVVKIGSKLIDSSIRTKLIGLERIMKGA
jgi:F-type H+-transporting ATPase subunit delta